MARRRVSVLSDAESADEQPRQRRRTSTNSTPVRINIEEDDKDDEEDDDFVPVNRRSREAPRNQAEDNDDNDDDDDDAADPDVEENEEEEEEEEAENQPQALPRRRGQRRQRQPRMRKTTHFKPELQTLWETLDQKFPPSKVSAVEPPSDLKLTLLPFQKEGLGWMLQQENSLFKGGILADEMGMGKTIQMIALMLATRHISSKPTLIACPTIALMQWKAEIERYTTEKSLEVILYYGQTRDRNPEYFKRPCIFLTTYSTIESDHRRKVYGTKRKDQAEPVRIPSPLFETDWFRIILDEAHSIKDRSSNTARAVFQLRSERKWSMSGTPLQNRVGELYSLIRFLEISPFSHYYCGKCDCQALNWQFSNHRTCDTCGHRPHDHYCWWNREIMKPIQRYGGVGDGREAFAKLSRLMPLIMLRRTKLEKADDLGLPPRVVVTRRDYFNEEEEDFYQALYSESKTQFLSYVQQDTLLNNYAHVFELITRMRQAADHPFLCTHRIAIEGDRNTDVCGICQEIPEDPIQAGCKHLFCREDIARYLASSFNENADCPICFKKLSIDLNQPTWEPSTTKAKSKRTSIISRIDIDRWRSSTKIEALLEELTKLREAGDTIKSIVFSQYVNFLDLIEWRLHKAGFRCVKLDGTMSSLQRDNIIKAFMTMPQITVFLISLKAGGIALNLTEASRVFLLDPWWNPAVEAQAMDRIHRLGQYRPIIVTRIIIENSIESRIIQLQEKKNLLFQSTVGMDVNALSKLSEQDLSFLFAL